MNAKTLRQGGLEARQRGLGVGGGACRLGDAGLEGDLLEVVVRDDGPGLPESANLFVPFFSTKPEGEGTGMGKPLKLINHPVRNEVPIFWASLMSRSVTETARYADGWLPVFFDPEKFHTVWGDDLKAGQADRDPDERGGPPGPSVFRVTAVGMSSTRWGGCGLRM